MFNAKTYDVASRQKYLDVWEEVRLAIDKNPAAAFFTPIGDRATAQRELHQFHRVRTALRAQMNVMGYDHIVANVSEQLDPDVKVLVWGIRFVDRNETIRTFKVHPL